VITASSLSWSGSRCGVSRLPVVHPRWHNSEQKLLVARIGRLPLLAVSATKPHRAPLSHVPQHHLHVPLALQPVILHLNPQQKRTHSEITLSNPSCRNQTLIAENETLIAEMKPSAGYLRGMVPAIGEGDGAVLLDDLVQGRGRNLHLVAQVGELDGLRAKLASPQGSGGEHGSSTR
jgi:hypothetical protein